MSSFKDLKNNRMNNLQSLTKQVEKLAEKPSYEDERIWKCERDKTGNGYAVVRFLSQHLRMKMCHGFVYGHMVSKGQVDGTLRIH